jgi:hypothetical protein
MGVRAEPCRKFNDQSVRPQRLPPEAGEVERPFGDIDGECEAHGKALAHERHVTETSVDLLVTMRRPSPDRVRDAPKICRGRKSPIGEADVPSGPTHADMPIATSSRTPVLRCRSGRMNAVVTTCSTSANSGAKGVSSSVFTSRRAASTSAWITRSTSIVIRGCPRNDTAKPPITANGIPRASSIEAASTSVC